MHKLIFVMAVALGTAAQAAEPAKPMVSPACRTEAENLCPATGDRDARRACMMEKRSSISAPCQAELKAAVEARRAARAAEGRSDTWPPHDMGGMAGADQSSPPPQ